MGGIFGNILNFLTSPIGFVIIFGLIGGLGKLGNWFAQEKSRRGALQARARSETEALRMGRPTGVVNQAGPSAATASPAQREDKDASSRSLQEQRAAQLRVLQQKRLQELRAKRMQQSSGGSAQATPSAQRPATPPSRPQTPRPQPTRTAQRPVQPPDNRGQPSRTIVPPSGGRVTPRPPVVRAIEPESTGRVVFPEQSAAPNFSTPNRATGGPGSGFAALLVSQADLRRAVLLSEVLGPPVSDRDPDQTGSF
jgi:hypothetical protein